MDNIISSQSVVDDTTIVPLENHSNENATVTVFLKTNKKRIKKTLIIVGVVCCIAAIIASIVVIVKGLSKENRSVSRTKKVLFIIADGIPADLMENLTLANVNRIKHAGNYRRIYVGGENGTYSETITISAPGYMCLLTGTWGNKHNVYDNDVESPNYNYKNIFRLFKEQNKDKKIGIFSTWIANRLKLIGEGRPSAGNITFDYKFDGYELDLITYPHDPSDLYIYHIDQRVVNETENCIKNDSPDLSWVYLQYTDDAGHMYGDSQLFNQAIIDLDKQVGQIYESIEYRIQHHNEDWLLILTTDHGRDPITGQEHGEQTLRERTTWIVTNYQQMNKYYESYSASIVDILPTIVKFMDLNIPIESERELDGIPFIGNVSLVEPNINLYNNTLTITWKYLDNTGNVTVWLSTTNQYKTGLSDEYQLIGSVPIEYQNGTFDIKDYPSKFYKILLKGKYNMVNRWIYRQ